MRRDKQRFVLFTHLVAVLTCVSTIAWSQSAGQEKKRATATVAGRVMLGDKPMPRAMVSLNRREGGSSADQPPRTHTDAQGNYLLTNVPAGTYWLSAICLGYVSDKEANTLMPGKQIVVEEGDTLSNMDFELKRGGVITGRISDASGRPVIGISVRLNRVDERGKDVGGMNFPNYYPEMLNTDDRGEYRIFGLLPGRYKVSVGSAGTMSIPMRSGYFAPIYYPGVTDMEKAEILEVSEGGELDNINISFASPETTYTAMGRIIDAVSGEPLAGVYSAFGNIMTFNRQQRVMSNRASNNATNANGEFKIEGLTPGRYAAFVSNRTPFGSEANYYSSPVVFEVKEEDVTGLEIKAFRGASLSGTIVFEGEDPAKTMQELTPLMVSAHRLENEQAELLVNQSQGSAIRAAADGSFTLSNVEPGSLYLNVFSNKAPRSIRTIRLEVNGEERRRGVEVKSGEQVTGVRIVLAYASASLRGNVKIENGSLPENTRLFVTLQSKNLQPPIHQGGEVDSLGRFQFQGLMPGDYEVEVRLNPAMGYPPPATPPVMPRIRPVKQTIRVTNGAEARVSLVLDLSPPTDR